MGPSIFTYYMSPAMVAGNRPSRADDVFCTGYLLWELVSGQHVFRGANEPEGLTNIQQAILDPPSTLQVGIPRELDQIVMQALSKDPVKRQQSMGELRPSLATLTDMDAARGLLATLMQSRFAKEHDRFQSEMSSWEAAFQTQGHS